jgi:hypothetical protein
MEKEKDKEEWTGTSDDETVLPMHDDDDDELSNDGDADLNERMGSHRKSIKGTLWVILTTTATLAGRRILRSGFREYIIFSFSDLTRADMTKLIVSFRHHNKLEIGN